MIPDFEWDCRKAASKLAKHGVSFAEAVTAFRDPYGRIVQDPRHSHSEERLALVGRSERRRLVAIMFTEREDRVRLISARKATRSERNDYEEASS